MSEISRLAKQITDALQSPPVQKAITKTLLDFANARARAENTIISQEDAKKLMAALGSGVKDAASQEVIAQIKKSPEFRKLEESLEA